MSWRHLPAIRASLFKLARLRRVGSVKPAPGEDFARNLRVNRRVGRDGPRHVSILQFVGCGALFVLELIV